MSEEIFDIVNERDVLDLFRNCHNLTA